MGSSYDKFKIRGVHDAFDEARKTLGLNATAFVLNRDWKAQRMIVDRLREMGQTRLVNLTHKYAESAIAIPFYAGDGNVIKVMNHSDLDRTRPIYNIPPISVDKVETESNTFVIAAYPWLTKNYTPPDEIEELRAKMQAVGLDFALNDDHSRNFHTMPDQHGTLVGIDASMYTTARNGKKHPKELAEAWQRYVHTVFPVYEEGIKPQTEDTSFQFRSSHRRESGMIGFNSTLFFEEGKDPIIQATQELTTNTQSIWGRLFGGWSGSKGSREYENEGLTGNSHELA